MKNIKGLILLVIFLTISLTGCQSFETTILGWNESIKAGKPSPESKPQVDAFRLAREGIIYLQKDDDETALKLFNAALKFGPEVSEFHMLAGMAYHIGFMKYGNSESRDNAEIGYQLAAKFKPRDATPWLQLGRLHMDGKLNQQAMNDFAKAAELQPNNSEALSGLVQASYLTGDIKTALWASEELSKRNWDKANVNRMRAVLYTVVGQEEKAQEYINAYSQSQSKNPETLRAFEKRLDQIKSEIDGVNWLLDSKVSSTKSNRAVLLAQSSTNSDPSQQPIAPTEQSASSPTTQGGDADQPSQLNLTNPMNQMNPMREGMMEAQPAIIDKTVKPWTDCKTFPAGANAMGGMSGTGGMGMMGGMGGGGGYGSSGGSSGGGEETTQLQALPAPCEGDKPPRMVVIDAVMLRTEDEITRSYGVNLLQGLTGLFSTSNIKTSGVNAVIDTRGIGGAASAANIAPLIYSLNIANATNNRNEVLARPSLLAVDRTPSTFFSGTTLSIAVGGAAGSINQLIDKPIGVSLSITPTIIDDENILLAVKMARSFVQLPAVGVSGAAVSTSRNSVTANITAKFGQTIVLSGLTERELMRGDSGVPVLKDIPGIQYMFDKTTNVDFFRTVMVMITPRKPVTNDTDIAGVDDEKVERRKGISPKKKYQFHWRIDEYEKVLNKYAPNLDTVLDTLETNQLYKGFKGKDLVDTNWATKSKMEIMLRDLKDLLVR